MFSRFRSFTLGLRLKPRGELFVSLLAIGLAVAFPAMALVWTTVRALDRGRREWSQELQALHRFRLEEALRTLDADLNARAARAGHRSSAKPAEAGVLFRDLLGVTGTEPFPEGFPIACWCWPTTARHCIRHPPSEWRIHRILISEESPL